MGVRVLASQKRGFWVLGAFAFRKKMKKYWEEKHHQQSSCLALHASCSSSQETIDHIQVASFYELDHSKLPSNVPHHLNSIRVVMVNDMSMFKVSVRFPSLDSLKTHLNQERDNFFNKQLPAFDQSYSMAPESASEVLYRRVSLHEMENKSRMWSFWARKSPRPPCCLSELNGMLKWGKTKLVRCVSVRESLSSDEKQEPDKEETEVDEGRYDFRKRKQIQKKPEAAKRQKQSNEIVVYEGFIERWSAKRYKAAEENILKVMKEKGVCAQNPIRRAPLRYEARKLIGDTGLIDHLLKHMVDKVAPDGAHRFRRRHDADGALEFWLETADLMRIREEAGVVDPYWTPPLGWKIGDNPTQDPICGGMFKEIWKEIANLKREREFQRQEDLAVVTASKSSLTNLDQGEVFNSIINGKDKYKQLAVKKSRIEEQLLQICQSCSGVEEEMKSLVEEMRVLKPTMEESASASAVVYSETAELPMLISDIKGGIKDKMGSKDKAGKEDKAAKIERLRSSFKIRKPQGTVMWPGMSMSPKGVVQQTNSFLVPTPPSVSSINMSATRLVLTPNGHNPVSPLKPLAERRAVSISTLRNLTKPPEKTNPHCQVDSISIGQTLDIDLNEFPDAYNTDSTAIPRTHTYKRKHKK